MPLITIATYSNTTEAQIAKGLLEAEGIRCQLKNEIISQTLPVGVELMVAAEDEERAESILESGN